MTPPSRQTTKGLTLLVMQPPTSKQASKVKAAWEADKAEADKFTDVFTTRVGLDEEGIGTVFVGPGAWRLLLWVQRGMQHASSTAMLPAGIKLSKPEYNAVVDALAARSWGSWTKCFRHIRWPQLRPKPGNQ
jgi:hypothetical protein